MKRLLFLPLVLFLITFGVNAQTEYRTMTGDDGKRGLRTTKAVVVIEPVWEVRTPVSLS